MIGVFDSGIGGLTVLEALRRRLPRRDFVYVADSARLPYGNKTSGEVRQYAFEIMDFLEGMGVEGIVMACNTASAAALPAARWKYPIPVWGIVDATVEAATRRAPGGYIGVIATQGTIASGVYQRKLAARGFRVWTQACPQLVQAAEEHWDDAEILVRRYLQGMPRLDTLILGCTHFVLLRGVIQRVAGPAVRVVDGADQLAGWIAEEVEDEGSGRVRYFVTGGRASQSPDLWPAANAS
jgi:glutamate racemase